MYECKSRQAVAYHALVLSLYGMILGWQGVATGGTFSTADITGAVQSALQGTSEGASHLLGTTVTASVDS